MTQAPPEPEQSQPQADTLGMEAREMRRLGYLVVDTVVDRLCNRNSEPAILTGDARDLALRLHGPLPESPIDPDESIALLVEVILSHQQHGDHPRYFARVPGPSSFAAILGDWLGTGFNAITASWAGGSGPAAMELVVIDWLRELMGMPANTEGILVSGGSHANLTAFAAVKASLGTGVIYLTEQTHASLPRALKILGFNAEQLRMLACDSDHRMCVNSLETAITNDLAAGLKPLMVIATAGTTNTGAVDQLNEIADICDHQDLWFHVDGAYGAPAALAPAGRAALAGLERAHSLVLDPHKWLFQPYDAGCLLIRPGMLERSFDMNPEYLKDVTAGPGEVDFRNRGLELTRRSRAAKLWLSLRTYGVGRFRGAIEQGLDLAEFAERYLREDAVKWRVVSPAQLGIVCFAHRASDDADHEARVRQLASSGFACVSSTRLKGQTVFRLCTINPLTSHEDIKQTIDRLGT